MAFGDFVQANAKDGTGASDTCAYTSNVTPSTLLVAAIRLGGTGVDVTSITDTRGNTWQQARPAQAHASDHVGALWYAINSAAAASANTITVNQSGSSTLRIAVLEYVITATSNILDQTNAGTGTGTAVSSGDATTTTNSQLCVGMISTANQGCAITGSGWADRGPDGTPGGAGGVTLKLTTGDKVLTVTGTEAVTFTLGASNAWVAMIATFSATSLGGGGSAPMFRGT